MEDQLNPLERDHSLSVVLPGGLEKSTTVHGSKPVMDLLVTLCARYHLNPSDHTVEVLSPNKNNISFKPNSPIGSLEAEKIVLKPKGIEEKTKKPYMPEATVRLLINYKKSHKAVVRVNPRVPLELLMPAVCEKCEFKVEATILLKDSLSQEPLDLTKSLNDLGLREVFAKDTDAVIPPEVISPPPLQGVQDENPPKEKKRKEKENKGFLSLFRRKTKPEASPGLKQLALSVTSLGVDCSNSLPADMPKKRAAPQPPTGASHSVPSDPSTHHPREPESSAESMMKRTKRRAPPPPCTDSHLELSLDTEVTGTVNSLHTLEELREHEEPDAVNQSSSSPPQPALHLSSSSSSPPPQPALHLSSSSSPPPPQPALHLSSSSSSSPSSSSPQSVTHPQKGKNPYLTTLCVGTESSHARFAMAKILTSSLSNGTLKCMKSSATFPGLCSGSSFPWLTQTYSDNEGLCAELGSDPKSYPSTELEWEDPLQKKRVTTFKVVPSKKQRSYKVELTQDLPDQCQMSEDNNPMSDALAETRDDQAVTEEGAGSPERPETETPVSDSELSPLEGQVPENPSSPPLLSHPENQDHQSSPNAEVEKDLGTSDDEDHSQPHSPTVTCLLPPEEEASLDNSSGDLSDDSHLRVSSHTHIPSGQTQNTEMVQPRFEDEEEEGVQQEEGDHFPPPPPPVFYHEEMEGMEEGREDSVSSSLLSSPPSSPTCNGKTVFTGGHLNKFTSAGSPTDPEPSRFAQAVALAVQRSRSQNQRRGLWPQASGSPPSTSSTTPETHINTVPDWLPHTSLNGSSCLG